MLGPKVLTVLRRRICICPVTIITTARTGTVEAFSIGLETQETPNHT